MNDSHSLNLPRGVFCLIKSFQTALVSDQPAIKTVPAEVDCVRHASLVRHDSCKLIKLEAFVFALLVVHEEVCSTHSGRSPNPTSSWRRQPPCPHVLDPKRHSGRISTRPSSCRSPPPCPGKTRCPASPPIFPYQCFPLVLRSSSAAQIVSVCPTCPYNRRQPWTRQRDRPDAVIQATLHLADFRPCPFKRNLPPKFRPPRPACFGRQSLAFPQELRFLSSAPSPCIPAVGFTLSPRTR